MILLPPFAPSLFTRLHLSHSWPVTLSRLQNEYSIIGPQDTPKAQRSFVSMVPLFALLTSSKHNNIVVRLHALFVVCLIPQPKVLHNSLYRDNGNTCYTCLPLTKYRCCLQRDISAASLYFPPLLFPVPSDQFPAILECINRL